MGLTKEEWSALPPEKRAELRVEQTRIDAEERRRNQELAQAREMAANEERREQQRRLEKRIAKAKYGDIVIVTLEGGSFEWGERRYPIDPVAFELVRGQRKLVPVSGVWRDRNVDLVATEDLLVSFSEDGNILLLDWETGGGFVRFVNTGRWDTSQRYSLGIRSNFGGENFDPTGMFATIRYKPVAGAPSKVILEKR